MASKKSQGRKSKAAAIPLAKPSEIGALDIPEVLFSVFFALEKRDAAVSLRVCRLWHDVGIARVWRELDSIFPLLRLISPLKPLEEEVDGGLWAFEWSLDRADWNRLRRHSEHVKELTFDVSDQLKHTRGYFSVRFMAELILQHPFNAALLPCLRTLVWMNYRSSTALNVLPFLAESIESLSLVFRKQADPSTVGQLIRSLSHRAPQITKFHLSTSHGASTFEGPLVEWMNNTQSLKEVDLPPFYQTPQITSALKKQTFLIRIGVAYDKGAKINTDGMEFTFGEDAFSRLETLALDMTFSSAARLFRSKFVPAALAEVLIHCSCYTSLDPLRQFLHALASSCRQLKSVALDMSSKDAAAEDAGDLTEDNIRPLLSCSSIHTLEIQHVFPFIPTPDFIEEMGRAWSRLETLILCDSPAFEIAEVNKRYGNDLSCLQHYATAMPFLRRFGLYFTKRWDDSPLKEKAVPSRFRRLEELRVGISRVPNKNPLLVGVFLENLCSGTVPEITYGEDEWYRGEVVTDQWRDQMEGWKEVETVVKVVRQTRETFKAEYGIA